MMDKGKKAKVDDDDPSEQLDTELVLAVEKLQEVQDELEKVNEEASDKELEVEQKYNEIRCPIYKKRNEIIQSIPDFWLTAFLSHPMLADVFNEEDQKVLKHLLSLDVEDFKDVKSGYTITFNFRPNPYFEDTKLVKVFRFSDEGTTSVSGTPIRWKDGMDVTNSSVKPEKEGNKRRFSEESFFKWFSGTQQSESAHSVQDEIADVIKEDLWLNPLKYFNNDEDSDEYEDEDGDYDDEEEEDEGKVAGGFDNEDDEDADEDEDE